MHFEITFEIICILYITFKNRYLIKEYVDEILIINMNIM